MISMQVKLTSALPLLMHNERLANPLDPAVKALKPLHAKRKKTEDDYEALSYLEFKGGIYHDEAMGPYIPAHWILGTVRDGAEMTKQGRDVVRAVMLQETQVRLDYVGPRDIDGLWKKQFYDRRMVGNQKNRVLRTRPRFDKWSIEFGLMFDETVFDSPQMVGILQTAGRMVGLGDYRPVFGRFDVEIVK